METTEERNYYAEAIAILSNESLMLPERGHLEAMQEHTECLLIRIANSLETLKRETMGRS